MQRDLLSPAYRVPLSLAGYMQVESDQVWSFVPDRHCSRVPQVRILHTTGGKLYRAWRGEDVQHGS